MISQEIRANKHINKSEVAISDVLANIVQNGECEIKHREDTLRGNEENTAIKRGYFKKS